MSPNNQKFEDAIKKLIKFASLHNVSVKIDSSKEDSFYPYKNKIYINERLNDVELTMFYLLHEIGHLITHLNADEWRKNNLRYTSATDVDEVRDINEDWYHVANLSEEHDAWRNGKILARQLKIEYNIERYEAEWADAMRDYIEYAYNNLFKR